jgi:hypothetical protein
MNRWYPAAVRMTTVRASLLTLLSFSIEDSPPVAMHVQGPTAKGHIVHGSKKPVMAGCYTNMLCGVAAGQAKAIHKRTKDSCDAATDHRSEIKSIDQAGLNDADDRVRSLLVCQVH